MLTGLKAFLVDDQGVAASEYAVMLALIVLVSLTAIMALGIKVRDVFTIIVDRFD